MESIVQTKNNDSLQLDGNITTRTNDEDQFAIVFRNLFDGRQDVVCLSSEMAEYVFTKAEIDTHFENHLAGKCRMGSYNLLPDGTVRWAMIEFEDHGGHKLEDPQKASLQADRTFYKPRDILLPGTEQESEWELLPSLDIFRETNICQEGPHFPESLR